MRYVTRIHGNLLQDVPKLGPAITESVPPPDQTHGPPAELDVGDDRNLNSKYVLSGRQREILKTQEAINRSDQNDNILKKRDEIPERIHHLVEDVALLSNSPYISSENWKEGHVNRQGVRSSKADLSQELEAADPDLDNFNPDIGTASDGEEIEYYQTPYDSHTELWEDIVDVDQRSQQIRDDTFLYGNSALSKETQLGFEIGSLLRMLQPPDTDDSVGADLIWGFVLAFTGRDKYDLDRERDTLSRLVNEMKDRHDTRMEDANLIPDTDEITEERSEKYQMTAEAVEERGFEPHPIIVEEVLYHQTPFEDEQMHKGHAKEMLSEIEDVVPLAVVDDLYNRLASDIRTVHDTDTQEIDSVHDVIAAFESAPANKTSANQNGFSVMSLLTAEVGKSVGVRKAAVTPVLNRLSNHSGTESWTTTPVLVQKENSGEWRLTAYGKLLHYITQYHQGNPSGVYRIAVGPEEISLQYRKVILEVLDEQGDLTDTA